MKLACIQPEIVPTRKECYNQIDILLRKLIENHEKPDLICLPERWVPFKTEINKNFQPERGSDYLEIKKLAKKYQINILSGAIWEKRKENNSEKNYITCYFFNSKGEEIGRQDKIHLYTYESNYFQSANELKIFKFQDYHFSILICFDMAFYETPRLAAENGADLLISPTQIREEGLYNWNIYLQARALENKVPVMACNTVGTIKIHKIRHFLGKSKIISFENGPITPSKLVIKEAPTKNGFVYDDIDLSFPRKLRNIRLNEKIDQSSINIKKVN
ncbi:MAG: carbon-nitrogen hydrolase family protein [Promethearchaeota archaeon]|nr:MAG: carbon-nitrogen hydrolase family protein [Candidatus Lokiarchaeota archaeon]